MAVASASSSDTTLLPIIALVAAVVVKVTAVEYALVVVQAP